MATHLAVFAAGSLRTAFNALALAFEDADDLGVELRFDNARALRLAIEAGAHADVFASASRVDPDLLAVSGIMGVAQVFAANSVVLAIPAGTSTITGVRDAGRPGVRLAVEIAGVPLGEYTREAIRLLAQIPGTGDLLANVVAQDEDVLTVARRVLRGEADAAFLYRSDVVTSGGRLEAIELPHAAQVAARYVVAVARATPLRHAAERWLELLLSARGQAILRDAGFGPAS